MRLWHHLCTPQKTHGHMCLHTQMYVWVWWTPREEVAVIDYFPPRGPEAVRTEQQINKSIIHTSVRVRLNSPLSPSTYTHTHMDVYIFTHTHTHRNALFALFALGRGQLRKKETWEGVQVLRKGWHEVVFLPQGTTSLPTTWTNNTSKQNRIGYFHLVLGVKWHVDILSSGCVQFDYNFKRDKDWPKKMDVSIAL